MTVLRLYREPKSKNACRVEYCKKSDEFEEGWYAKE